MTSDQSITTNQEINQIEEPKITLSMHPQKFAMWLFIVTVVMLFAAMTSAYIVRQAEGNWLQFNLPDSLYVSSVIILLSSVTMHWAYISAKKDAFRNLKLAIIITTVLGFTFTLSQWQVWKDLVAMDVFFVGNPAGSFMYVITGLHVVHLLGGVVFLAIIFVKVFQYKVHAKNMVSIEMCSTYWHFLDGLWLYLFMFLILNH